MLHTVLTGDVIKSSRLQPEVRAQLPGYLHLAFESVQGSRAVRSKLAFDVFRGDSWQLYAEDPREGLRVVLMLRAWLRARADIDTRAAIVIDTVDFVNRAHLSESDGKAFRRSGYALDALGRRSLACLLPEGWTPSYQQLLFNTIASAAGAFAERWTQTQAQAVALTMSLASTPGDYAGQEQVAEAWPAGPIKQQTVSEHLQRAHWDVIVDYLTNYFSVVGELVEQYSDGSTPWGQML